MTGGAARRVSNRRALAQTSLRHDRSAPGRRVMAALAVVLAVCFLPGSVAAATPAFDLAAEPGDGLSVNITVTFEPTPEDFNWELLRHLGSSKNSSECCLRTRPIQTADLCQTRSRGWPHSSVPILESMRRPSTACSRWSSGVNRTDLVRSLASERADRSTLERVGSGSRRMPSDTRFPEPRSRT
jgi:hypothetical protein